MRNRSPLQDGSSRARRERNGHTPRRFVDPRHTTHAQRRTPALGRLFVAGTVAVGALACSGETGGSSSPARAVAQASVADRAAVDGFFARPQSFALTPGQVASVQWRYRATSALLESGWQQPGFDDGGWDVGSPGFSGGGSRPEDVTRTPWPADNDHLWMRTTFTVTESDIADLVLWGRWDDTIEVYINGVLAASRSGWSPGYDYLVLDDAARQTITSSGSNTIAVHVHDTGGGRYADIGLALAGQLHARPRSGCESNPALAQYTDAVEAFMVERSIPAGVLAVTKGDELVLTRGLGWANKDLTQPLQADAVLRLASVDKVLTHFAVRKMIDEGTFDTVTGQTITDHTPVFPALVAHGLTNTPGTTPDPRIDDITIRHLLNHVSGVRELPWQTDLYAEAQVTPGTSTPEDNVRWTYSAPLMFDPGTCPSSSCYNSNGYAILRYLVEVLKGDFLEYLQGEVGAPAGTTDVFVAHERLAGREPREPWYLTFEEPHDRWIYLENFYALSSTAPALVRLLRHYSMADGRPMFDEAGNWDPRQNGYGAFFGSMGGTWSVVMQRRWDEVNVAVIFNRTGPYDALHDQLYSITSSLTAADFVGTGCEDGDDDGLDVQISVHSDWGSGYCGHLVVHNGAAAATTSWSATLEIPQATFYTAWNGSFSGNTGTVTVQPPGWLQAVQPGETNGAIGFCANRAPGTSASPRVTDVIVTY